MSPVHPSRRQLILGAAAAGLTATAWSTVGHLGTYPTPTVPWRAITDKDAAVWKVLGDWFMPPDGPLPGSAGDERTLAMFDAFVANMPAATAQQVHALMALLEHGTAMDRFGSARLTACSPLNQHRSLTAWATSDVLVTQQLWNAVKVLVGFTYFDRPDVLTAMGMSLGCRATP